MNKTKWMELISKAPHAQKLTNKNIKYPTKKEQLEAVRKNGDNIQWIRDPDREVQLEAVRKNGWSIQWIHDPDKDVQLEAVRKNGDSIQHIHNPDREVIVHYLIAACPELLRDPRYDLKEDE